MTSLPAGNPEAVAPITQTEVARALGINRSTVSRALSDSPKIRKDLRDKIRATAEKMGYHPNPLAAGLAQRQRIAGQKPITSVLAWLNLWPEPETLRSFKDFDRYWRGATATAEKFGYRLEEFRCNATMSPQRVEQILISRGIHGVLVPPLARHRFLPANWKVIDWNHFSAVRFGRSLPYPNLHLITSDQVANGTLAFKEMYAHGYKRVGLVTSEAREWGGLFEAGFFMGQQFIEKKDRLPAFTARDDSPTLMKDFAAWLRREKPDAIFTDKAAAPDFLKKSGYRVPEDIGLAVSSVLDGGADAGIDQNSEEIGRVAVLVVLSLINDNSVGIPAVSRQILVEGTWTDGSSLPRRL